MRELMRLVREKRRREQHLNPLLVIFHIFIDPVTKVEATDLPRMGTVIGGPQLQQESDETAEQFKARVMAIARQLRKE